MKLRWKIAISTILLLIAITVCSIVSVRIMQPTSTPSEERTSTPIQYTLTPYAAQSQTTNDTLTPYAAQSQTTNDTTSATEGALTMAKEAFAQNYTEPILQCLIFRHYENTSVYWVSIYYSRIFNYSEGEFHIPYRHDYIVNTQTKTIDKGPTIDIPEGFVAKFIGKEPTTSIEQATQIYFMLLDKSPSKNYYIYSVEDDQLNLEATETDYMYCVTGTFRNFAVNCINAKITITYNIFHNGTAILKSLNM